MVWVDWCIVVILAVSVVFGVLRGFVKEALSLAAWVIGFWVALAHWDMLAARLDGWIDSHSTAAVVAFAVLLFGTLLIGALINHFVAKGLAKAGLEGFDRALGALFGLVRGVAIAAVVLMFAGLLHADRSESWQRSKLVPYFGPAVKWMRSHLDDKPDFGRTILGRNG
jgi:membrane protein required for colicin V production